MYLFGLAPVLQMHCDYKNISSRQSTHGMQHAHACMCVCARGRAAALKHCSHTHVCAMVLACMDLYHELCAPAHMRLLELCLISAAPCEAACA